MILNCDYKHKKSNMLNVDLFRILVTFDLL